MTIIPAPFVTLCTVRGDWTAGRGMGGAAHMARLWAKRRGVGPEGREWVVSRGGHERESVMVTGQNAQLP